MTNASKVFPTRASAGRDGCRRGPASPCPSLLRPAAHGRLPASCRPAFAGFSWVVAMLLGACASARTHADERAAEARVPGPIPAASQQLVVVTTPGWDATSGTLRRYERGADRSWRAVDGAVPVTVGRKGSAWGLGLHPPQSGPQKREGDGRAPAGVFRIGTAFGYAERTSTKLAYAAMDADDWCIDVPASPRYNRLVDAREVGAAAVAGSTEPMRRDLHLGGDRRYAVGFVIEHNADAVRDAGSCIFAHIWKAPGAPTAGCTATDEASMRALLAWLDRAKSPIFVLVPGAEHSRLRDPWRLP